MTESNHAEKTNQLTPNRLDEIVNTPHMARFSVKPELIAQALRMPEGHKIVGAEWDFVSRAIRLYVDGPTFPETPWGMVPLDIMPTVTVKEEVNGERTYTWDWGL